MVVAATGFFDGVHKGHQKVLSFLCETAAQEGKKSAVITFWPHPRNVLQQQAYSLRLLTSLEEKKALVKGEEDNNTKARIALMESIEAIANAPHIGGTNG